MCESAQVPLGIILEGSIKNFGGFLARGVSRGRQGAASERRVLEFYRDHLGKGSVRLILHSSGKDLRACFIRHFLGKDSCMLHCANR